MKNEKELYVIKRDGRKQLFDPTKITNAILKAIMKVGDTDQIDDAYTITNDVCDNIMYNFDDEIDIKDIEKIVEIVLMGYDKNIAREYTSYRSSRDASRMRSSILFQKINGLMNNSDPTITAENANKDAVRTNVQRDLAAGIVSKEMAFDLGMIPPRVVKYYNNNYIHYHDLDYAPVFPMYNCMLIDLKTMFNNHFLMNNAIISKPKSFQVFCNVSSQIAAAVASAQYGGQTIDRFDEIGAEYVTMSYRKIVEEKIKDFANINDLQIIEMPDGGCIESINYSIYEILQRHEIKEKIIKKIISSCMNRIEKEVYDGIQTYEYQINTISSSNGQTPFCTVGFGLGTSVESRLIQKKLLEVRIGGLGDRHITPVFPKLVFTICKGINFYKEDPNYDIKKLAMKCSSIRMYPDILNYENVCRMAGGKVYYKDKEHRTVDIEKSEGFKAPMGCRSFLHIWHNPNTGLPEYAGRFNLGVISVNLVKIALEAREYSDNIKDREEYFYNKLSDVLDVAKEGLISRVDNLRHKKAKVAPILWGDKTLGCYGATGFSLDPEEEIGPYFTNRSSVSLGYVGLHEAVIAIYGQKMFKNEEMTSKGIAIMETLHTATQEWKNETGLAFSVYGTPAESLAGRFINHDRNKFGIVEGITDKEWYTNSFHLDVEQEATAFEKLDFESNFVKYSPGGCTHHIDVNSLKNNPMALEPLWDYSYEHTNCPYVLINTKEDRCFADGCNYIGEMTPTENGYCCPNCGNTDPVFQSVIRRISGYITDASSRPINHSKKNEIDCRYTHY